jgi:uncharacterized protein DUF4154
MAFLRTTKIATVTLIAVLLPRLAIGQPSQSQPKGEYALKAVFLYNFCRFIEWPKSAFVAPNEPIVIGVIGEDPFGSLLREAVQGETSRGRAIQIEHYNKSDSIGHCHLLFVSRSEAGRVEKILAAVSGRSVVTVGENDVFLDRGGMIALTADRNRVRLHINPTMLRAASLDVSSKLLRVAEVKP